MTIYYTARGTFDAHYDKDGMSWEDYIKWSRLTQLTELVTMDGMLNELLVQPNHDNEEEWTFIVVDDGWETGFFTSLDYVLQKIHTNEKFNLLAVAIQPEQDCMDLPLEGFEFVGYDLLDKDYGVSALTNCGGFDETFLPSELNQYGLLNDYNKAFDIKRRLVENNPMEHHADTNVIGIWRHTVIGKKGD